MQKTGVFLLVVQVVKCVGSLRLQAAGRQDGILRPLQNLQHADASVESAGGQTRPPGSGEHIVTFTDRKLIVTKCCHNVQTHVRMQS